MLKNLFLCIQLRELVPAGMIAALGKSTLIEVKRNIIIFSS
jgi:hypothetical protein